MGIGKGNAEFLAEEVYSRARRRLDLTLGGVREALDSLVALRGHKSLLLISEGFLLVPGMPGYAELIDTARRANVAVHFLDPRGLESGYGEEEPPGLGWATKRLLDAAGADDVAAATGGRTIVSNDPGEGLRRIAAESEAYYLLGYQPAEAKAGERKVKVRVKREGLSVRARSRYFVESPAKAGARPPKKEEAGRTPAEAAAMRSLADTTELPLRVGTLFFGDGGKGEITTMFAAEVDDAVAAPASAGSSRSSRRDPGRRRRCATSTSRRWSSRPARQPCSPASGRCRRACGSSASSRATSRPAASGPRSTPSRCRRPGASASRRRS
jgi:hypothetical protein